MANDNLLQFCINANKNGEIKQGAFHPLLDSSFNLELFGSIL